MNYLNNLQDYCDIAVYFIVLCANVMW